ncbi:flavin reductase family protein [Breoghania sp.]|uniref:flavin reductase family protein n=1 Tax=Breoghania sp. TaxID=2065378 RepID=UPI002AAA97EB|nr:flavin reductase family protein [Breoghania sp.]
MSERDVRGTALSSVNPNDFRQAMSLLSQQVHLVTTIGSEGRFGVTVTAAASVSDDPPTMLFCVNRSSRSFPHFESAKTFCINTLTGSQQDIADAFAGRGQLSIDDRFALGEWAELATGAPVLKTALAAFDCRLTHAIDMATHRVFFGEVEAVASGNDDTLALAYRNRGYVSI